MNSERPYRPAPELQRVLDDLERMGNPLDRMTAENAADIWLFGEVLAAQVPDRIPVAAVRDLCVPARNRQIPIRVYVPAHQAVPAGGWPVLVYYHGGGWTLGSITTYDSVCRKLANAAGVVVVSVDYRLAPEHPFPAAVQDAHLALHWVARNIDNLGVPTRPGRLAVGGDSAGGNLATVVAVRARKEQLPVTLQVLIYPSTNLTRTDYPSYQQYGQGHWLTTEAVEKFRSYYLPNPSDWCNPEVAPLLAPDADLALLPPAIIFTAGCDPLRDEGQAYADRLQALGVHVEYRMEPQMIHACLNVFNSALFPYARPCVEPVLDGLARAVGAALAG